MTVNNIYIYTSLVTVEFHIKLYFKEHVGCQIASSNSMPNRL